MDDMYKAKKDNVLKPNGIPGPWTIYNKVSFFFAHINLFIY